MLLLVGAACTSGSDETEGSAGVEEVDAPPTSGSDGSTPPTRACTDGPSLDDVTAAPGPGEGDVVVTSFDGTEILAHWFPSPASADEPAPTILMGPGWSLPGDTSTGDALPLFGALGIGDLNDAGYNVLTWDPRGFHGSGGTSTINDPEAEGRDVQALLDWVAEQPEARLDREGDPRSGMVGFSYGGGIQLSVASRDCRVDALVPGLAWHSLETSLFKSGTAKLGWADVLLTAAAGARLDPHITSAHAAAAADGTVSDEDVTWFRDRGPGDLVQDIQVPTLFVHGTTDTLFTLDEAVTNHLLLRERDIPSGMIWFCGGHGVCLTEGGETEWISERTFAWLDRWVMGDESVDTGPEVEVVDQQGDRWTTDDYPADPRQLATISRADVGTLRLTAEGGSGPVAVPEGATDVLSGLVAPITPAPAANAIEVRVDGFADGMLAIGPPRLELTYRGTSPAGPQPTRVFAQLVDPGTGIVVGTQVTPVPVELDGEEHTVELDLEVIAHDVGGGAELVLQLVATTVAYAPPRLGGEITFERVQVGIPVTQALTEAAAG